MKTVMRIVAAMLIIPVLFLLCVGTVAVNSDKNDSEEASSTPKRKSKLKQMVDDANPEQAKTSWNVQRTTNPMTDTSDIAGFLKSTNTIEVWLPPRKRGTLVLQCKNNTTSLYVNISTSAHPELGLHDKATVNYRIDSQEPIRAVLSESTDGEALFFPQSISVAKNLKGAKKLLFEFTPFNSPNRIYEFDLTGYDEVLSQVREECGW